MSKGKMEGSKPEVINIKKAVNYQKGSVVSRALSDKKSGTVTLFAFDEGEALSEHTAPFDAILSITDGEAEVTVSGVSYILREGEMIIMPEGESHSLRAVKRFKMMLVMIRG
jgi:quercetin dioxygenase-like cupin family protein